MGTTRPKIRDLMPVVDRIDRRLASCASFLSCGGRLQVVKSVFSSLPAFALSVFRVQEGFKEAVDKRRRIALWNKSEITGKCKALAAWDRVCRPKDRGGLGILNLTAFNEAQMVKFLYKFYNHMDTPWVNLIWKSYYTNSLPSTSDLVGSFWWKDLTLLIPNFKAVLRGMPGNGASLFFWMSGITSPSETSFPESTRLPSTRISRCKTYV